ncbi:thioredoxin TrxC [Candidatus Methylospira mobilis]|uniref:Thioredoxin TrxC n=1 Tax=Candidatus Methylospira mobilis TaxID=1808979 RepID=A0A5Q0BLL5_9GAMM|nr:thioredoxin TrxC [Candidatus Methylospira mobilis]QFY44670.1 thioredoxin TrxC [Candidatus Methylospira mobilis]
MSNSLKIVCPHCVTVNRLPLARIEERSLCGNCKHPLFTGKPVELNPSAFGAHLLRNDIPVVVDFWAPWCAPCRTMAPAFEQAAHRLEPGFRFSRLNTEQYPKLGDQYNVRSIPTLIEFVGGHETRRQSGAMDAGSIVRWLQG